MARFNRHRPALCPDCQKPMSVKERRAGGYCAWDSYQHLRAKLEGTEGGFWISEPNTELFPEDHEVVVVSVDPGELFGLERLGLESNQ